LYDLASPNKCQPLFLEHDDEADEEEAVEVDEVEDDVDGDEVVCQVVEDEEVAEEEETETDHGEEVLQTVVGYEGTTISPWMLVFFLPLVFVVGTALFPVFQAATTFTTVFLRIGETFAPSGNNSGDSPNNGSDSTNSNSSSRRRRAARRRKTGRTRIGRILKCRFAGGRRFRPARSRRSRGDCWARGQRKDGDEILVMDDDSARIFEMVLAFLRGGANPGDQQQVCVLFLLSNTQLGLCLLHELLFSGKPNVLHLCTTITRWYVPH
jgi:hypothetical protein